MPFYAELILINPLSYVFCPPELSPLQCCGRTDPFCGYILNSPPGKPWNIILPLWPFLLSEAWSSLWNILADSPRRLLFHIMLPSFMCFQPPLMIGPFYTAPLQGGLPIIIPNILCYSFFKSHPVVFPKIMASEPIPQAVLVFTDGSKSSRGAYKVGDQEPVVVPFAPGNSCESWPLCFRSLRSVPSPLICFQILIM